VLGDEVGIALHAAHLDPDSLELGGLLCDEALQLLLPGLEADAVVTEQAHRQRWRRLLVQAGEPQRVVPALPGRTAPVVHRSRRRILPGDWVVRVEAP
jgi:hypothetical protein